MSKFLQLGLLFLIRVVFLQLGLSLADLRRERDLGYLRVEQASASKHLGLRRNFASKT